MAASTSTSCDSPLVTLESLEGRRLMSAAAASNDAVAAVHTSAAEGSAHGAFPATPDENAAVLEKYRTAGGVKDRDARFYTPNRRVKVRPALGKAVGAAEDAVAADSSPVSLAVNAVGLPLLNSRSDTNGGYLNVFLDFDGYTYTNGEGNVVNDPAFDMTIDQGGDNNTAVFNAKEQAVIYNAWRDIVSYFSMFNVNVTTVQPPTGGNNPTFVWQRITDGVTGGAAFIGSANNNGSTGWVEDSIAIGRTSAIAHEIGHILSITHQADYNEAGTQTAGYSSGYKRHGPIMGVDFAQNLKQWSYGRNSDGYDRLQNDLVQMADYLRRFITSPYRADDYTGTTLATASPLTLANGTFQTAGTIGNVSDADFFGFTSTGQAFDINVQPLFESALAPKIEVYRADGTLIASKDNTTLRDGIDNNSTDLNLTLPAGQYVVKVASHGDYGDIGEYAFYASPLPGSWKSEDVNAGNTGRGGNAAYDPATAVFTQGGSGNDIWNANDAFRYTYLPLTGNGSITARVTSIDNTDFHAKTGLMLRESLASNSRHVMMAFKPSTSEILSRTTTNGNSNASGTSLAMGTLVRLTRNLDTITITSSADGVTFNNVVGTITLSGLSNQVFIGLATTSHNDKLVAASKFANVATTGNTSYGNTLPNTLATPANVTAAPVSSKSTATTVRWSDVAGETGYAIERSIDGLNWTQIGTTAADVTTYTDASGLPLSMRWWYRVAAVDGLGKSRFGTASVVNKPNAPTNPLIVQVSGSTTRSLTWRDTVGDTGYRVERSTDGGNSFTTLATLGQNIAGYNDTTSGVATGIYRITPLSPIGDGVPLVMNPGIFVTPVTGVAIDTVTSGSVRLFWNDNPNETGYRVERSLKRTTGWATLATLGANVTNYTDTTATALNHYFYRVVAVNDINASTNDDIVFTATPAATATTMPWVNADIGSPAGQGAGTLTGTNTATLIGGGGSGVNATEDQYNFLYRGFAGDGEIVARLATLENIGAGVRGGVVFRESLAPGARSVGTFYNVISSFAGTDMVYRNATGAAAVKVDGPDATSARFLRVVRQGNTFTSYASSTGATGPWVQIGQTTLVDAPATMFVGLAATAGDNTQLATATFDSVSVGTGAVAIPTTLSVNAGQAQRSRVTSVAVTFAQGVNIAAGGLTLFTKPTATATATQVTGFTLTPSAGGTVFTLTFPTPAFAGHSLADGLYEVRVAASAVTTLATGVSMASDSLLTFHRLAGDNDGNRAVNFDDFAAMQTAFGSTAGSPSFLAGFDFDDSGSINFDDFATLQTAFGKTI